MSDSAELDRFFGEHRESRQIFDALAEAVKAIGQQRSGHQEPGGVWRNYPFAWAWMPEQYLKGEAAPLVLTVGLRRRGPSPRW